MIIPMFLLVIHTVLVNLLSLFVRIKAVKSGTIKARYFKIFQGEAPDVWFVLLEIDF